eukprot:1614358-Rhodomonas_salina.2
MKKKLDELGRQYQHKCRASFLGFTQIERYAFHETFAAVASSAVVRLVIALAIGMGLKLHQLDVVRVYLYAALAEELFMWAPKDIHKSKGECWRLLSHLYCGRAAGAAWKALFRELLIEFGMKAINLDETVFVLQSEKKPCKMIIVCMYVDDEA